MGDRVRILVVDDSEIFAQLMASAIEADARTELAGVARNGREAVEMTRTLRPDVVSMDVYMPEMNGLEAIEHIMQDTPTPIVMVTAAASEEMAHISFRAVGSGALDVLAKPEAPDDTRRIVTRLRLLAGVRVRRREATSASRSATSRVASPRVAPVHGGDDVPTWTGATSVRPVELVALVISTGGPPVLEGLLRALDSGWNAALLIVQHLSKGFDAHLVDWLAKTAAIPVELATTGTRIRPGVAYVAPAEVHLRVRMGGRLEIDTTGERIDGHRPSGTALLESVATAYGSRAAGIVLTGMGQDGASGLLALRRAGGLTAAQDSASSAVDGMPRIARSSGAAAHVVSLDHLHAYVRLLGGLPAGSE